MNALEKILAVPLIDRTRRNHGLEHATITLLSQKYRGLSLAGRSTQNGFYLYGHVSAAEIEDAAQAALQRMKAGERHLAVHPNCGTNFVVAGFAAALAGFLGFFGARNWRDRLERLPFVASLATFALIFAQPVGLTLQRDITTSGEMREMEIISIEPRGFGNLPIHFITTRN
ncbi:MAG: hypothetical protein JNL09_01445 [Anaerolineales bacterium]|nr:hypothetical protein [Anaerolineales bacterium]